MVEDDGETRSTTGCAVDARCVDDTGTGTDTGVDVEVVAGVGTTVAVDNGTDTDGTAVAAAAAGTDVVVEGDGNDDVEDGGFILLTSRPRRTDAGTGGAAVVDNAITGLMLLWLLVLSLELV